MVTKQIVAMKAFLIHEGLVLILRESVHNPDGTNAGRYDIVGGRVEPGEAPLDALRREIREETGLEAAVGRPFAVADWRPVVRGEEWQIIATFFECAAPSKSVTLGRDHDRYEWIDPQRYRDHLLIANLHPVFEAYLRRRQQP